MDGKCKKPVKFGGTPAAETRKEALQNNGAERLLFEPIRVQFLQLQGLTAGTRGCCFAPIGRGAGGEFPCQPHCSHWRHDRRLRCRVRSVRWFLEFFAVSDRTAVRVCCSDLSSRGLAVVLHTKKHTQTACSSVVPLYYVLSTRIFSGYPACADSHQRSR